MVSRNTVFDSFITGKDEYLSNKFSTWFDGRELSQKQHCKFITDLIQFPLVIVLLVTIGWMYDGLASISYLVARWAFAVFINLTLKDIFRMRRPNKALLKKTEFGCPSTHSMISLIMLHGILPNTFSLTFAFLIGCLRILQAQHFLVDVFVGWTCGFILLQFFPDYYFWKHNVFLNVIVRRPIVTLLSSVVLGILCTSLYIMLVYISLRSKSKVNFSNTPFWKRWYCYLNLSSSDLGIPSNCTVSDVQSSIAGACSLIVSISFFSSLSRLMAFVQLLTTIVLISVLIMTAISLPSSVPIAVILGSLIGFLFSLPSISFFYECSKICVNSV